MKLFQRDFADRLGGREKYLVKLTDQCFISGEISSDGNFKVYLTNSEEQDPLGVSVNGRLIIRQRVEGYEYLMLKPDSKSQTMLCHLKVVKSRIVEPLTFEAAPVLLPNEAEQNISNEQVIAQEVARQMALKEAGTGEDNGEQAYEGDLEFEEDRPEFEDRVGFYEAEQDDPVGGGYEEGFADAGSGASEPEGVLGDEGSGPTDPSGDNAAGVSDAGNDSGTDQSDLRN